MPGFIINGKQINVPGLSVKSWKDDPGLRVKIGEDGRVRPAGTWVRSIVIHTTKGIPGGKDKRPQLIKPGMGPNVKAGERVSRFWATSDTAASAHLIVDFDGQICCVADLQSEVAYHAPPVNGISVGIEIYQGSDAELYEGQLDVTVRLIDFLTKHFSIQRQIPKEYLKKPVPRLATGGADVVGVYGHRDVSNNRGAGDPGDRIMEKLKAAGYESFDLFAGEDLKVWKERQAKLNLLNPDGIAGPGTVASLKRSGKPSGLWVDRPIDRE